MDEGQMEKIIPPENCPDCSSKLVFKNDMLYCEDQNCPAKTKKGLEHWAKTMKIKGLGPASIDKLQISSILELYQLSKEEFVEALGTKIGEKVYSEVVNSRQASLDYVLPAFGISLIGRSATDKLKSSISHLDDLTSEKASLAGLGPKATSNLMTWYENYYQKVKSLLPFSFKFSEQSIKQNTKGTVCITGKIKTYKTKAEAEGVLKSLGYSVKSSVTKEVTILVNESGIESAKTRKARDTGVSVVTNLNTLIEEG